MRYLIFAGSRICTNGYFMVALICNHEAAISAYIRNWKN